MPKRVRRKNHLAELNQLAADRAKRLEELRNAHAGSSNHEDHQSSEVVPSSSNSVALTGSNNNTATKVVQLHSLMKWPKWPNVSVSEHTSNFSIRERAEQRRIEQLSGEDSDFEESHGQFSRKLPAAEKENEDADFEDSGTNGSKQQNETSADGLSESHNSPAKSQYFMPPGSDTDCSFVFVTKQASNNKENESSDLDPLSTFRRSLKTVFGEKQNQEPKNVFDLTTEDSSSESEQEMPQKDSVASEDKESNSVNQANHENKPIERSSSSEQSQAQRYEETFSFVEHQAGSNSEIELSTPVSSDYSTSNSSDTTSESDTDNGFEDTFLTLSASNPNSNVFKLGERFHSIAAKHDISDFAANDLWNLMKSVVPQEQRNSMKCFKTVRNRHYKVLPPIFMDIEFEDSCTGEVKTLSKKEVFPKKLFQKNPHWRLKSVVTYVRIKGILKILYYIHPELKGKQLHAILSDDGVPESKSRARSVDILSIKFEECSIVFPIKVVRCEKNEYIPPSRTWPMFIDELKALGITVEDFCADAKKRCEVLCQKQFNGFSSCPYCYSVGETRGGSTVVFPAETWNADLRTDEDVRSIMENLEKLTLPERHGYWGKSPLLQIENFDICRQVPCEYLHLVCLGVVRSLLRWSLDLPVPNGTRRDINIRTKKLEKELRRIKLPSEFSRRIRGTLDVKNLKGTEFRNIAAFYFVIVANGFKDNENVQKIWTLLGFLLRLYIMDEDIYEESRQVLRIHEKLLLRRWYFFMELEFGASKMFFNNHVFGAHANLVRRRGPFTRTSTFRQEHLYGRLQKKFYAGTISSGKQLFQRSLVQILLQKHVERKTAKLSGKTHLKTDDSIFRLQDGRWFRFVDIVEMISEDHDHLKIEAFQIHTKSFQSKVQPDLNFDLVQFYAISKIDSKKQVINTTHSGCKVAYKGLVAGGNIMTIPQGVFDEEL